METEMFIRLIESLNRINHSVTFLAVINSVIALVIALHLFKKP